MSSPPPAPNVQARDRLDVFRSVLATRPPGRLLDLASGHGAFAMEAHRYGWAVTAVDARTQRFPDYQGVTWLSADVREFDIETAAYDLIACLGLLYHLELSDQVDLLRRCSAVPTLVDTHVSLLPNDVEAGYRGHHFDEYAGREEQVWRASGTASWGNRYSFWLDQESTERMFHDTGFDTVWRLTPYYQDDRTFWLCFPAAGDPRHVATTTPWQRLRQAMRTPRRRARGFVG